MSMTVKDVMTSQPITVRELTRSTTWRGCSPPTL
jgi:hypothetical protein